MSTIRYNTQRAHKRINKSLNHMSFLSKNYISVSGRSILETGTGGHGIDIVMFFLVGAKRIFTFDVMKQLTMEKLKITADAFSEHSEKIANTLGEMLVEDIESMVESVKSSESLEAALGKLRCKSYISENANPFKSEWNPEQIDLFYSESNIQRIPLDDFHKIVGGISELMPSGGLMLHQIDCSDIVAQRDFRTFSKDLHPFYYLVFSEDEWVRMGPREQGSQNRLREFEFYEIFCENGFQPLVIESIATLGHSEDIKGMGVEEGFLMQGSFEAGIRRSRMLMSKGEVETSIRRVFLTANSMDGVPYHIHDDQRSVFNRRVDILGSAEVPFHGIEGFPIFTDKEVGKMITEKETR